MINATGSVAPRCPARRLVVDKVEQWELSKQPPGEREVTCALEKDLAPLLKLGAVGL